MTSHAVRTRVASLVPIRRAAPFDDAAARVPRSALTFSSAGDLGVRTVAADGKVAFAKVGIVEDEQGYMWVSGLTDGAQVIVQGQDFVSEGQQVEAVSSGATAPTASAAN